MSLSLVCALLIEIGQLATLSGPLDFLRIIKHSEFWSLEQGVQLNVDSSWIRSLLRNRLIAHRLGDYEFQNTIQAAIISAESGFKFLEVDLFEVSDGRLICHHGPELPPQRLLVNDDTCTLKGLIKVLEAYPDVYLILDIKTDYLRALRRINDLYHSIGGDRNGMRDRLIFQIYAPRDIRSLEKVFGQSRHPINAPIVTLYNSHSKASVVDRFLPDWVAALTVPVTRSAETAQIQLRPNRLLLTHPVTSCASLDQYASSGFVGFYGPSYLAQCPRLTALIRPAVRELSSIKSMPTNARASQ